MQVSLTDSDRPDVDVFELLPVLRIPVGLMRVVGKGGGWETQ